jgi:energy-coupling factor transporter transmembrane protein EcfT
MPMLLSLFQGSLDRAASIAEAMSARGFGSSGRTRMKRHLFRARDAMIAAVSLALLGVVIATAIAGKGAYSFFPTLSNPWDVISKAALIFMAVALFSVFTLARSWKKWHWLRSKI